MAKVAIATLDTALAVPPPAGSQGVTSLALLHRARDPIHLAVHRLSPGGSLQLEAGSAAVTLFTWTGEATAGGARLGSRASAIVEPGGRLALVAGAQGAQVLAFVRPGSPPAAAETPAGRVHLLPRERVPHTACLGGSEGIGGSLHADAQLPGCGVWLHENSYAMADKETPLHSHSEDEVIFVHTGSIRLGRRLYGPGTALAIAANTIYGFHSGPDGLGFVNFRATSPTFRSADGSMVLDEAELWRGLLGSPDYLAPAA